MRPARRPVCSLALIATLAAAPAWCAKAPPANGKCVLEKIGEIILEGAPNRPILTAQINGQPARFVVDTGSSSNLIFTSRVAKFGLKAHALSGAKTYGLGGASQAAVVSVGRFEVGGIMGRNAEFLVTGDMRNPDADGVIGAEFLLQSDVEFDMAAKRRRFFRPKDCRGDQVVYWNRPYAVTPLIPTQGKAMEVEVSVNGARIRAELDSGSPRSILIPEAAKRAGVKPASPAVKPEGAVGGLGPERVRAYVGTFASFGFGDEVIHNANLRIADMFHADTEAYTGSRLARDAVDWPQMLLGADFFRAHRIYVAESQHKIYVSYVGGPVFDTIIPSPLKAPAAP